MAKYILLNKIKENLNKKVVLKGWIFNFRSSGSIYFIQFRDGTGKIQIIASKDKIDKESWEKLEQITRETSIEVTGKVYKDERSPHGFEMQAENLKIISIAERYPIGKKSHGIDFLMNNRHLWIRSERQRAILKIRDEIIFAIRKFFKDNDFTLTDSPIITPTAGEETTSLFEVNYFDNPAFLSQTGQLYIEALIYSLGRVYDFGPTFRAEKSKTRRHLTEFWMMDAEAAFVKHEENIEIQEKLIEYIVKQVLKNNKQELKTLKREIEPLKNIKAPFPKITYNKAIKILKNNNQKISWGEDFGAEHETIISNKYDKPVIIEKYPVKAKAFYMKEDPENNQLALADDMLAPEGYGEIIGGSERISDKKTLERKIKEFNIPKKPLKWYIDLRKYGSVPHSGFGLGIERTVAWICGLDHIRETIPFPRLLNRINP